MISKIIAKNFKSFEEIKIDFNNLNIIIGANSSGKSNLVSLFAFINNITRFGIDDAISMQGDIEHLINVYSKSNKPAKFEIYSEEIKSFEGFLPLNDDMVVAPKKFSYKFSIAFDRTNKCYKITQDIFEIEIKISKIKEKEEVGTSKIIISSNGGKLKKEIKDLPKGVKVDNIFKKFVLNFNEDKPILKERLQIELPASLFHVIFIESLRGVGIYNIDINSVRKANVFSGKNELEYDGSNIAFILKKIQKNKENKQKLVNLIKKFIPYIEGLEVYQSPDKTATISLKEKFSQAESEKYFPACMISDGTLNLTAILIALYFGNKHTLILEEPEKNVHPKLIPVLMSLIRDRSKNIRIFITTHNPLFLKDCDIKEVSLISRDSKGISHLEKPSEKARIKEFIKNDIGLDELYIQNLL